MSEKEYFKKLEEYDIEVNKLFQENEKLNNIIHVITETLNETYNNRTELRNENKELKSKLDKAIEYIHNNQPVFELSSKEQLQEWFEKEYYVELLKILKGE